MSLHVPTKLPADLIVDPAQTRRMRRGRRYRSLGWVGVLLSAAFWGLAKLTTALPGIVGPLSGVALAVSVLLVNWTRLWVKESKEPFKYTYSVGEFLPGPDAESPAPGSQPRNPIGWLGPDLTEKLSARVARLSLLDEADVPRHEEDEDPAPHVHITGWYGPRRGDGDEWYLEVIPRIRIGGAGAPSKLARTIRFKLLGSGARRPPPLDAEQYSRLFERVYWSVASEIYAQIRRGVEQKVMLLPPGRLRATAYLYEADDYATSNTLDAFDAARGLYRKAQESFDRSSRTPSATAWREMASGFWTDLDRDWCRLRRLLARFFRRFGRREILAARAQLGYARMLVAEWNLRLLCGSIPKELFDAPANIRGAIRRVELLPADIAGWQATLFRAYVTLALALADLENPVEAERALDKAEETWPGGAREDAEFLLAAGIVETDRIRSLRFLTAAVELAPHLERARYARAERLEAFWRRRDRYEPAVAETIDAEYAAVIALDPGNVSAWANRGYIGWLLCTPDPAAEKRPPDGRLAWRERAISSLEAGRQYKEVRGDAMVAELNWNLARLTAEAGDFAVAYDHYIQAVSAMMGEPRIGFSDYFYQDATTAMMRRYAEYENRVGELVEAATDADDGEVGRLIGSVHAFVLNDCASACYAFHQRTGDAESLHKAIDRFGRAIELNRHFLLPKFNLGMIGMALAFDVDLAPEERATWANSSMQWLREVLDAEPDYLFARLRLVELEAWFPAMAAQFGAADDGWPACEADRWLRPLLPHRWFRRDGTVGGLIDLQGTYVPELLANQRIDWATEFDGVQVSVLLHWAEMLAVYAPKQAIPLCECLKRAFYETPILYTYLGAAHRASDELSPEEAEELRRRSEGLLEELSAYAYSRLKADPAHFENLAAFLDDLAPDHRVDILSRARKASPSPAVVTLVDEALQ